MKLTAANLVRMIKQLPRDQDFEYVDDKNNRRIRIARVVEPEGPIWIKRYRREDASKISSIKEESLPKNMLRRLASAVESEKPIHIDRVFDGSYNTRSVLESLLAHTPNFSICRPGRIEVQNNNVQVFPGHKHIIYSNEVLHENGIIGFREIQSVSRISHDLVYSGLSLELNSTKAEMTIDEARRHAQIQIALIKIGVQLGFRTWIAQNDRGIVYEGKRLAEHDGVVDRLDQLQQLSSYSDAAQAAKLIDCIWFKNGRLMPAVMEVEHSTGVTSGLTRMKGFFDLSPQLRDIRWVIVADDSEREKVTREARREQFRVLKTRFFPYSAVEELFSLCTRRKLHGVTEEFLDSFMEPCPLD